MKAFYCIVAHQYIFFDEQDSLELLNNLIRSNTSNQVMQLEAITFKFVNHMLIVESMVQMLLKETVGFDPLVSILKLRRGNAYNFTQQKV